MPVAIGFPRPLPEWFASVFASLSGLAAIEEPGPQGAARRDGRTADPQWEEWWTAWRSYAERKSSSGG